ncbi:MAG: hypothetical protein PQ612_10260 [Rickettsiales bacterium]|nr:hypothetical protein [Pseudomonadota bacterium]MDA0967381.1 hypothetical protein [Pseudomonadota bacterium]MDG4544405.1 hypothetical protein [Rickettsiales bacterium]MDG4546535.1 hypothetical protein [Rickettsiales bacterium]MDG4548680.1 hypothetical protein [Rickettsiales bacterium]
MGNKFNISKIGKVGFLIALSILAPKRSGNANAQDTELTYSDLIDKYGNPEEMRADVCDDKKYKDIRKEYKEAIKNGYELIEEIRNSYKPKVSKKDMLEDMYARNLGNSECGKETNKNLFESGYPVLVDNNTFEEIHKSSNTGSGSKQYLSAKHNDKVAIVKKIPGKNGDIVNEFNRVFLTDVEDKYITSTNIERDILIGSSEFEPKDTTRFAIGLHVTNRLYNKNNNNDDKILLNKKILKSYVSSFSDDELSKDNKKLLNKSIDKEAESNGGYINLSLYNKQNSDLGNALLESFKTIGQKYSSIKDVKVSGASYGPIRMLTKQKHSFGIEKNANAEHLKSWCKKHSPDTEYKYTDMVKKSGQNFHAREL